MFLLPDRLTPLRHPEIPLGGRPVRYSVTKREKTNGTNEHDRTATALPGSGAESPGRESADQVAGNAVTVYSDGELKIFNITSIIIGLFLTWLFAYIANKVLIKK